MRETVSDILVRSLKTLDVNIIFGIPGKPIVPLLLALDRQGLQFILSRHEAGAGFAAAGYSLLNKTLGVALGTSGPGGTNMLTAAAQAKALHLPVLFITGQVSTKRSGTPLPQDGSVFGCDLVKMFESVTLFSARVERGDHFPIYFQHALEKALFGRKGPVHLNIPEDVLTEEIEAFEPVLPENYPLMCGEIGRIIPLIEKAKRPVLFIGKGVHFSEAYKEVREVAERWEIPIIITPGGKGCIADNHPLFYGAFGLGGSDEACLLLKQGVDLMLIMGSKLCDMSAAGLTPDIYPQRVIQFDADLTFVGKSIKVPTVPVLGDIKTNLQELLRLSEMRGSRRGGRPNLMVKNTEVAATLTTSEKITAAETFRILRKLLPADTIVFGDAGSHTFHAVKHFEILQTGTFFFDEVWDTMGHGIGFAVGAQAAKPDHSIVCITGDGCLFMHGMEISTAVCENLPVVFVVLNNASLDMVHKGMKYNVQHTVGTVFKTPINAALFGRSLGASSFRCFSEEDIQNAIRHALISRQTTVVEVMVDQDEIPPTLKRG